MLFTRWSEPKVEMRRRDEPQAEHLEGFWVNPD